MSQVFGIGRYIRKGTVSTVPLLWQTRGFSR
jgi:hypothetical protein